MLAAAGAGALYRRVGEALRFDEVAAKPTTRRTKVIVPVTTVSRLTGYALSEALSLSQEVTAVMVVLDAGDQGDGVATRMREEWSRRDPRVPMHVLRTEYASVVEPIVGYIDDVCAIYDEQVVVLIPVIVPSKLRYNFLHNHLDLVLSNALKARP